MRGTGCHQLRTFRSSSSWLDLKLNEEEEKKLKRLLDIDKTVGQSLLLVVI